MRLRDCAVQTWVLKYSFLIRRPIPLLELGELLTLFSILTFRYFRGRHTGVITQFIKSRLTLGWILTDCKRYFDNRFVFPVRYIGRPGIRARSFPKKRFRNFFENPTKTQIICYCSTIYIYIWCCVIHRYRGKTTRKFDIRQIIVSPYRSIYI